MAQQSLFPIRVRTLIPNLTGSADLRYFAIGDDGHEYAVKESHPGNPELPAAEYIGYCLSATCQIAVPATTVLLMPDGTFALGSRFEGGVAGFGALSPMEQFSALKQCAPEVTALLTLDVFLSNDDRHLNNFLQRKTVFAQTYSMIAIDFSRALWQGGFPTTIPSSIVATGNTAQTIQFMKSVGFWDAARSADTVASIAAVPNGTYMGWLAALPPAWVTTPVATSIPWWASPQMAQRISDTASCV